MTSRRRCGREASLYDAAVPSEARIRVARETGYWVDSARSYKIVIDGDVAGTVRPGECRDFPVSPGEHEVHAKIDWARSSPVKASVPEAGELSLVCRPSLANADVWRPWRVMRAISVGRDRYIDLAVMPAGD